jgi:hypothetical protein
MDDAIALHPEIFLFTLASKFFEALIICRKKTGYPKVTGF